MRTITKQSPPRTVTEARADPITNLTNAASARDAYERVDKDEVRAQLVAEQAWLCAFCMRRIHQSYDKADTKAIDDRGEPTMKIAHRTPIAVDPSRALTWSNLFGSCDGGQRSDGRFWTCDAAQGQKALTVDPTEATHVARLRYEPRDGRSGLFITSDDPALRADVEQTLALNSGDLPELREAAWKAFTQKARARFPTGPWGKEAWRKFLPEWLTASGKRAPAMAGVVEAKARQ